MKWKRWAVAGLLVFVLAVWYARLMTIGQLCPGLDLDACEGAYIYYSTYEDKGLENRVVLEGDDLAPLLDLIREKEFRRSPFGWIPSGSKSHRWEEDDFRWQVDLAFDGVTLASGGVGSGMILQFSDFFGKLTLVDIYNNDHYTLWMSDQDQWLRDVLEVMMAAEPEN